MTGSEDCPPAPHLKKDPGFCSRSVPETPWANLSLFWASVSSGREGVCTRQSLNIFATINFFESLRHRGAEVRELYMTQIYPDSSLLW